MTAAGEPPAPRPPRAPAARRTDGRAHLVAGLGFGDEGKGGLVDHLVRRHAATLVVRYNGGPQAAHHVVSPDGAAHCFAQLGAGTLVPGVRTHLGPAMAVDPLALEREEAALRGLGVRDAFARLSVDPRCVLVTPFHRAVNRIEELARGTARHGSCGLGVGQALLDAERPGLPVVRVGDVADRTRLSRGLRLLALAKIDRAEQLAGPGGGPPEVARELEALTRVGLVEHLAGAYERVVCRGGLRVREDPDLDPTGQVVFEGAQGVLLDRDHGFWPHVTPSRTTFAHAHELLEAAGWPGSIRRVGVLRAYATRHGAGPLPTEDPALGAARPDVHNGTDAWQGPFRLGWFDAVAARYALRVVGGVDALALTNVDRLAGLPEVRVCTAYLLDGEVDAALSPLVRAERRGAQTLVRDLWPPPPGTGAHARAALTALLARCRPEYASLPGWAAAAAGAAGAFLALLESEAGVGLPIATLSLGPRATDKLERAG